MQRTQGSEIVCVYPGAGKTTLTDRINDPRLVRDIPATAFSRVTAHDGRQDANPAFPGNYVDYLTEQMGAARFLLASSQLVIVEEIAKRDLPCTLVTPGVRLKEEFRQRYLERGDSKEFIKLMMEPWEEDIELVTSVRIGHHIVLNSGQFLSDVLHISDIRTRQP